MNFITDGPGHPAQIRSSSPAKQRVSLADSVHCITVIRSPIF
jgi:hypothetical protein